MLSDGPTGRLKRLRDVLNQFARYEKVCSSRDIFLSRSNMLGGKISYFGVNCTCVREPFLKIRGLTSACVNCFKPS